MARPRAIKDEKVFAIADQLTEKGIQPSIVRVAEVAKQRYGATPSYTTLKSVLSDWSSRPTDSKSRPKELRRISAGPNALPVERDFRQEIACALFEVREELERSRRVISERIDALEARIAKFSANEFVASRRDER